MKCDELKTETIVPQGCTLTLQMYPKGEVDAAITELKDENQRLKKKMDDYHLMSDIRRAKIKELKRALWLARAYIMTLLNRDFQRLAYQCNNDDYKRNLLRRRNRYYELSEKCIKKSKEYL